MKKIALILLLIVLSQLVTGRTPDPMSASVSPAIVVEPDDETDNSNEEPETQGGGQEVTPVQTGSSGGGTPVQSRTRNEEQNEENNPEEGEQIRTRIRTQLISQQVIATTAPFRVRGLAAYVNITPNSEELVKSLSDEKTKVLLYLTRAERDEILDMNVTQAGEKLKDYVLKTVNKSLLYKVRVIPQPAFLDAQNRLQEATQTYNSAKEGMQEEKQLFNQAKQQGETDKATEHARNYLFKTADLVIRSLEKVQYSVETSDDLSQEEADEIIAEIQAEIQNMQNAKSSVEAAETKEQVQAAGEDILQAWRTLKIRLQRRITRLIHAKLGDIIQRAEHLEAKLECTRLQMEEQGISTEEIDTLIGEFSDKVYNAKQNFREAKTVLDQAHELKTQDQEQIQEAEQQVEEAKQLIDNAKQQLKDAHEILKQIVRLIKEQGGEITNCEEPELGDDEEYVIESDFSHPTEDSQEKEFCGESTLASCETDDDCMISGCSGQICQGTNEPQQMTTCEYSDCYDTVGWECECKEGQCKWS